MRFNPSSICGLCSDTTAMTELDKIYMSSSLSPNTNKCKFINIIYITKVKPYSWITVEIDHHSTEISDKMHGTSYQCVLTRITKWEFRICWQKRQMFGEVRWAVSQVDWNYLNCVAKFWRKYSFIKYITCFGDEYFQSEAME